MVYLKIPSNYLEGSASFTTLRNNYLSAIEYLSDITKVNKMSRLKKYTSVIEELVKLDNPTGELFEVNPMIISAFIEVHEIIQAADFLKQYLINGTLSNHNLARLQDGAYAYFESGTSDPSRELFFEFQVASRFLAAGLKVDLSSLTDIVVDFEDYKFFIECKRVSSEAKFEDRIKEGFNQLEKRFTKGRTKEVGIVFISATHILNPKLGFLRTDRSREASFQTERMCEQLAYKYLKSYNPSEIKLLAFYIHLRMPFIINKSDQLGLNTWHQSRSFFQLGKNQKPTEVALFKRNKYFELFERFNKTVFRNKLI